MKTWPSPRILNASAAALFLAGIGLLYAGALKLAPLALFAAVLLCVLAAIATNAYDIERLQAAVAAEPAPSQPATQPSTSEPAPSDEPAEEPGAAEPEPSPEPAEEPAAPATPPPSSA